MNRIGTWLTRNPPFRLNTKLVSRDLEVQDLVKDFSDGVSKLV